MSPLAKDIFVSFIIISMIMFVISLTGCNQVRYMDYIDVLQENGQISKLTISDKKLQVEMK